MEFLKDPFLFVYCFIFIALLLSLSLNFLQLKREKTWCVVPSLESQSQS